MVCDIFKSSIQKLNLSNIKMSIEEVAAVCDNLEKPLQNLNLDNNAFTVEGVQTLVELILRLKIVEEAIVKRNQLKIIMLLVEARESINRE